MKIHRHVYYGRWLTCTSPYTSFRTSPSSSCCRSPCRRPSSLISTFLSSWNCTLASRQPPLPRHRCQTRRNNSLLRIWLQVCDLQRTRTHLLKLSGPAQSNLCQTSWWSFIRHSHWRWSWRRAHCRASPGAGSLRDRPIGDHKGVPGPVCPSASKSFLYLDNRLALDSNPRAYTIFYRQPMQPQVTTQTHSWTSWKGGNPSGSDWPGLVDSCPPTLKAPCWTHKCKLNSCTRGSHAREKSSPGIWL